MNSIEDVCAPFVRLANVMDALPGKRIDDETPLRDLVPGRWPTLGDVRRLRDFVNRKEIK